MKKNNDYSNIISLQREIAEKEKSMPHEVAELMCIKCGKRWIGVYPEKCLLKDIECMCGEVGYVIKTGQTLEEEKWTK